MLARPKVEPRERHEACPTLPLWQTTTLCGSETPSLHLKPVDPVSMQHNKDAIVSLPAVTYHSKTSLRTATLTPKSIHSDFAPAISTFHPFRSNDWVIVMVSAYCLFYQIFACTLFTPVIASRLEEIDVKDVEETAGYLSSIWAAGCVTMSPIAGWLPTVYKNKRTLLIVYIIILLAATLLFAFVPNVSGLMAGRLLHGLGASGAFTVALALLNENVSRHRLGQMNGLGQVGFAIGNSVSPTMGGALYAKLGWLPLCYFALALGGLNILLCLIYVEKVYEVPFSVESAENRAADVKALELKSAAPPPVSSSSLYIILKMSFCNSRYFIGVAVGICWGAFCNGVLYTALPLRLENQFGLSTAKIGYSFLAIAGPNVILAPLAGWMTDRLGARPLIIACLSSFILWNALMCIDALPYAGFLTVLVGVGASASFVTTPLLVYWTSVDRMYGSPVGSSIICGLYSAAVSVACLIFPLISAAVLGKVGISLGWKILLAIITGCLIACLAFVYAFMRLPEPESSSSGMVTEKKQDAT